MKRLLTTLAALALAGPVAAQGMTGHDMAGMDMSASPKTEPDHAGHDMAGMDMSGHDEPSMTGALGFYMMTREASGTAWQPEASPHAGIHQAYGEWSVMTHAVLNGVLDHQSGRRGDDKAFVSGMGMVMAKRAFENGDAVQLRAMISPDPFMGRSGYPLLLASGETADGKTPLIDRQHPHDLFMELSASYSRRLSMTDGLYVYAGLPGEPAFGPPAFMHRLSIMDSPEAPISHHWLDSTHITFGVLTGGYIHDGWKIEASRFHGREPDEARYNIETGALDSTAVRLSWNPSSRWSLQASWAEVKSPEQLEPDVDQTKWSASAIYTLPIGKAGWWSTTAAFGRRTSDHQDLDAYVLESAIKPNAAWTVFARAERTDNNELTGAAGHHGPTYTVGKASVGAIRDWQVREHVKLGLGGLVSANAIPPGLKLAYGDDPTGAMAFVRMKIE